MLNVNRLVLLWEMFNVKHFGFALRDVLCNTLGLAFGDASLISRHAMVKPGYCFYPFCHLSISFFHYHSASQCTNSMLIECSKSCYHGRKTIQFNTTWTKRCNKVHIMCYGFTGIYMYSTLKWHTNTDKSQFIIMSLASVLYNQRIQWKQNDGL